MLQQLSFHKQQTIKTTRVQDLDPSPCTDNAHESVLSHEMSAIEPSEISSRTLTWKPLVFLIHIKCRSNDDRFSVSQWESFICSILDVPTPALLGPVVHDWVVYKLGTLLGSVGHRVKILNITSVTDKERGDLEVKD